MLSVCVQWGNKKIPFSNNEKFGAKKIFIL